MENLTELKAKLLGSLLLFTQTFYKWRTGRDFVLSKPTSRECHYVTICRELVDVFRSLDHHLLINVPPGHGKSELLIHFIAWAMAHFPDSQFLYISYSGELAAKHTYTIKQIMQMPMYNKLFGFSIKRDSSAKDNFKTTKGGAVRAFGSSGGITGQDGGLPNLDRFSGAVIMDDMHKPQEVHSDTVRQTVKDQYIGTILQRLRGNNVPLIFLGQVLHEDDLAMNIRAGFDELNWRNVVLKERDEAGNILAPNIISKERLDKLERISPYVYAAQYQQEPQPAGGGIIKPEWFELTDDEPDFLATFITADTAETTKTYNDPSVFSFWGIYKINHFGTDTDLYGLHWIDCYEEWIEPKDLENEFMQFLAGCMRHPIKPCAIAIEKKSTGVTLLSAIKKIQGLRVIEVERTKASGSKTTRFLEMQPIIASKLVSLPRYGKHTGPCLEHMRKITANDTHRHDDRADTLYDAVKIALIDKLITYITADRGESKEITKSLANTFNKRQQVRAKASWHNR
jgi:predicted phage terminase large subunit-like protein